MCILLQKGKNILNIDYLLELKYRLFLFKTKMF